MADRFFSEALLGLGPAVLQGAEAHHLAHVRRLGPGDRVVLFNGDGRSYQSTIESIRKNAVDLLIDGIDEPKNELGCRLVVATALPKGDRADYLIEKLTELGVTDFTPLQTARSVVHPREARVDKLRRAVIEASKQCGRNVLMRVHLPVRWADYCRGGDLPAQRLFAHPIGRTIAESGHLPLRDRVFAVGPEGGWTEEEVQLAENAGWQVVALGPRTLRVETACVALAAWAGLASR
jgi:16S rRNA (uracil1498-N3)-methyltransferase